MDWKTLGYAVLGAVIGALVIKFIVDPIGEKLEQALEGDEE